MSTTRARSKARTNTQTKRNNSKTIHFSALPEDVLRLIAKFLKSEGAGPASGTLTSKVYYDEGQDELYFPVTFKLDNTAPNGTKTTQRTRNAFANAIIKQKNLPRNLSSKKAQNEFLKLVYGDPNHDPNSDAKRGEYAWNLTRKSKDVKPLHTQLRPRTGGRFVRKKTNVTKTGYEGTVTRSFRTVPIGTRERGTINDLYRSSKALSFLRNENTKQGRKSMQNKKRRQ